MNTSSRNVTVEEQKLREALPLPPDLQQKGWIHPDPETTRGYWVDVITV